MSEENVEILREAYEGGSDQGFEILLSYATDDIVWISDPRVPAGGTYVGKDAVRGNFAEMRSAFTDVVIEVDEVIDLGEDRVLGITTFRGGPTDGPKVEWVWCHLLTFRGGLIAEVRGYLDRESALEAAGLSE